MSDNKNRGKKDTILKDVLVLFGITIISGLLLSLVHEATRKPIERQRLESKKAAYQAVFPEASDFKYNDDIDNLLKDSGSLLQDSGLNLGNVSIEEVAEALDGSGNRIGYVAAASSKDGYNGNISLCVGIDGDGKITGIEMIELNETSGLGMEADKPVFKEQFQGKAADSFIVTKGGGASGNEINAISGATITSEAVTNAVNAANYFVKNCIEQ